MAIMLKQMRVVVAGWISVSWQDAESRAEGAVELHLRLQQEADDRRREREAERTQALTPTILLEDIA